METKSMIWAKQRAWVLRNLSFCVSLGIVITKSKMSWKAFDLYGCKSVVLADLTEALLEGGRDFSIQDLQNCLDIFPCSISAQITGKQAEEVCEHTHTVSGESSALSQDGRPLSRSCSKDDRSYNVNTVLRD